MEVSKDRVEKAIKKCILEDRPEDAIMLLYFKHKDRVLEDPELLDELNY